MSPCTKECTWTRCSALKAIYMNAVLHNVRINLNILNIWMYNLVCIQICKQSEFTMHLYHMNPVFCITDTYFHLHALTHTCRIMEGNWILAANPPSSPLPSSELRHLLSLHSWLGFSPPMLTCHWCFEAALCHSSNPSERQALLGSQLYIQFYSLSNSAETESSTTHPPRLHSFNSTHLQDVLYFTRGLVLKQLTL